MQTSNCPLPAKADEENDQRRIINQGAEQVQV
jgi:hypothetical protein